MPWNLRGSIGGQNKADDNQEGGGGDVTRNASRSSNGAASPPASARNGAGPGNQAQGMPGCGGSQTSPAPTSGAVNTFQHTDQDVVHTGDVILFSVRKADGYKCLLSGDGTVVEDMHVFSYKEGETGIVPDVRECLYRVVPQLCYTAQKELHRHKESGGEDHEALLQKVKQERSQNEARMAMRTPVRYGDVIQLLHVKSGKYITVMPKQTAPKERDARRVLLQDGGTHSAFVVQAFYKYKSVGELLLFNEQVIFSSQKLGIRWILHASLWEAAPHTDLDPHGASSRPRYEVNCSTDTSGCFFPQLFSRGTDYLQYGHVVRISYPQCDRVLGASCTLGTPKRPFLRSRDGDKLWAKGVWLLETPDVLHGGNVRWGSHGARPPDLSCSVCIRHLGTGYYLSVDPQTAPAWHKGSQRMCTSKLVKDPDFSCYFVLDVLEEGWMGGPVDLGNRRTCKALIRYVDGEGSLWLSCETQHLKKVNDKRPRPSLELFFGGTRRIRDAVIIESLSLVKTREVSYMTTILGWKKCFRSVARQLKESCGTETDSSGQPVRLQSFSKQEAREQGTHELFHQSHEALVCAIRFLAGKDAEQLEDPLADKQEKSITEHQRLVRELKLVDSSVVLMDALQEAGYQVTQKTSRTIVTLENVKSDKPKAAKPASRVGHQELRCLKLIVELWRCCFQGNADSETYFFRQGWLEKINDLNGLGLGAAVCLSVLVSNNKLLLQGVPLDTLQKFVDFIQELGPDETWLRFMQAVCSCQGQAIANKQQLVLQMTYYPGSLASSEEWEKWGPNRKELFLAVKLSAHTKATVPVNIPRGKEKTFPAMAIANTGVKDILVAWKTNKEPWETGKDWLYFHPNHLNLLIKEAEKTPDGEVLWVSLQDIAWTLNPGHCYSAVHPDDPYAWKNKKDAIKKTGTFKARQVLATYFTAQIDLMKEMVLDNQVNSIRTLQDEYSFDLICCALWDEALAPTVRCAFCGLLNSLWLVRHPHLATQLIPVCQIWKEVTTNKPGALWLPAFELDPGCLDTSHNSEFDRHPSASKFNLLVSYVQHHLEQTRGRMVHSHTGPTAYTAEVCRLLLNLLLFGFVSDSKQLDGVLRPILACLDGRTDWLTAEETGPEIMPGTLPPKSNSAPLTPHSKDTETREELTGEASVPLLCNNSCRDTVVGVFKDEVLSTMPPYFAIPDPSDGPKRYRTGAFPDIVEAKVLMCEVCATVIEIAIGNSVVQLTRLFAQRNNAVSNKDKGTTLKEDAARAMKLLKPLQFDFDAVSGTNFNMLLLDLMMYESPKIFVAAAKVMRLWNSRISKVFEHASEVIILGDAKEAEMYREMKRHVSRLSDLVNTTEDWGIDSALGAVNLNKFEDAKGLLEKIRYLCSVGSKSADSDVPDSRMQSILRSLRLGEALLQAYDTPYEDFKGDKQGVLTTFMTLVCKLSHQFIKGHAANQQYFHQSLAKIHEWTGRGIDAMHAIGAIYRGNHSLCEHISEDIIYEVGQLLVREQEERNKFLSQRLHFLKSLVVSGQRPIVRNKEIILNMLKNPFYNKVLLLFDGEGDAARRGELLRNFKSWKELEKPEINRVLHGTDSELEYHRSCLGLLASLCVGRDESGASAYVQAKCPALKLVRAYLDVSNIRVAQDSSNDCKNMCFALQRSMLNLVVAVYYDTELKDGVFYSSTTHLVLLEACVNQLQRLQWDLYGSGLSDNDEEFLIQIVHFFSALVEFTPRGQWHAGIETLLSTRLQAILTELAKPNCKVRKDNQYFKASVNRTLGWLTGDRESASQRLRHNTEAPTSEDRSHQLSAACHTFIQELMEQPSVQAALQNEQSNMIKDVCQISDLTDPANAEYMKEKDAALAEKRPVKGGFRRNIITSTVWMQRAIQHCLEADHLRDWGTTSFVITTVCAVLESLDGDKLKEMQLLCAKAGGERLVILTLSARPHAELIRKTLKLAETLLKPNNKLVQEVFVKYFLTYDDSDLWRLSREMIEAVSMNVKPVRVLKKIVRESGRKAEEVLTASETEVLIVFSDNVRSLERMLQFMQLLCEGHNSHMQQYVFQQLDNTISVNMMEKIKALCLKICKNESAADVTDGEELDILTTCFELLVEATTRPDARNQLFLSTSGIVEGVLKMINARFSRLRVECGEDEEDDTEPYDCYPQPVRSLKGQVTLLLLVMLELRPDDEVHKTLVIRIDASLLRRRLVFAHRWFLASKLGFAKDVHPHICQEDGSCILDDMTQEDGIMDTKLSSVELLEEYVEEDLINFFSEAFNIMALLHILKPHDAKFRQQVEPTVPETDKAVQARMNAEAMVQAKNAQISAKKYQAAYSFFNTWIKVIEVFINGRVYDVYFRMPVLCHFVLGSEKAAIMSEVPVEPPEAKVKDFMVRCTQLYAMTQHTRKLSKWAPEGLGALKVINGGKPIRPLLFFMKNDSWNLIMTSYICMCLALVINGMLFSGLTLPIDFTDGTRPSIRDPTLQFTVWCGGVLYLILTLVQLMVVGLTYLPIDHTFVCKDSAKRGPRMVETLSVLICAGALTVVPWFLGFHESFYVLPILVLTLAGFSWQGDALGCPNNRAARLIASAMAGCKRQTVVRRVFLSTAATGAVCMVDYFYSFLLLDVLFLFEKLQHIIKAVTLPMDSLSLTLLVGIIVMYIYAVVAFYYFRGDYADDCGNMVDCTVSTIYLGMQGEMNERLHEVQASSHHWYGRVAFDLSFVILITTILMNILFGIIVDTFGALRDEAQQRESSKKNTTFIASLERSDIDRAARAAMIPSGFDYLEKERQNCWNYMNFIFYLKRKNPIDFTGPETLINRFVNEEDISWLPMYNCLLLQRQEEGQTEESKEGAAAAPAQPPA